MKVKTQTPNLGPVIISKHVINKISKMFDENMDNALLITKEILQSNFIECLNIPKDIVTSMIINNDNPDALEFWVHNDSSTIFLVKPKVSYKLVDMVMKL